MSPNLLSPSLLPMASSFLPLTVLTILSMPLLSHQQPPLLSAERDSLFHVLYSINSDIPWRSLFADDDDDLCVSAPHGVVCGYPSQSNEAARIVELSFGYVSDEAPNPPCSANATLDPLLFTSFKYLRKLFFYRCFNESLVSVPDVSPSFSSILEELVFIENPSLVGPFSGVLGNFTSLRRLVLSGNGVDGELPQEIGELVNLEEITLSRNRLAGDVPGSLATLKKLKILDLSQNGFEGYVPESLGNLTELLKLDLSFNRFIGEIPESFRNLQGLEFLDLRYNQFGKFGVPQFIGEIPRLREIYLSGNLLGGKIPEIWENLGGVTRIGFSDMGLTGNIPASIGIYLRNLSYLGLDNNNLEGPVPEELVFLEFADEINMENNNLSGRVPFSTKLFGKLKLRGNRGLCVDHQLSLHAENKGYSGQLRLCNEPEIPNAVLFNGISSLLFDLQVWFMSLGIMFVFTLL
ncbi:piriformospora indica-insensitive protein 2-like [Prosopis cineraria]|uniref:piriformospora indica-insensitive protein 2-like n=1 Tax=Prosopis cineraria TaxID=364024 RepID=UPI002410A6E3|nr:piriformospora indica-insensitive protein 2-like [Prosopis cineraria]